MKRFISFLIALTMLFSLTFVAFAASDNTNGGVGKSNVTMTENDIRQYALNFMQNSQHNDAIMIKEFTPLYDPLNNTTGYYVTYSNEGNDAGYLLLSLITNGSPVVEFSFDGSGPIQDSGATSVTNSTESNIAAGESRYIYTGPDSLFVPEQGQEYYSVYKQKKISKPDIKKDFIEKYPKAAKLSESYSNTGSSVNIYDGIIDWADADVDSSSVFKISSFGSGTDYWLMTDFSTGGVCCPTAATNILWYWGFKRGCTSITNKTEVANASTNKAKATAIFNILYDGMGTDEEGTYDSNILDGYKSFFGKSASSSGPWNYSKISNGSSYSSYQSALNGNCPVMLILHTKNGLFSKGDGHAVYAFGYANSTNNDNYIFVMDGWNTYGRFVKFDYYPYFFGYKIWVK
jgi:hypothetical protein